VKSERLGMDCGRCVSPVSHKDKKRIIKKGLSS
jgi:hypothetical protein